MISKKYNEQMGNYIAKLARESKPLTNGDRIRGMTDEELAEFMSDVGDCYCCPAYSRCHRKGMSCHNALIDWLKSPVKDGESDG